MVTKNQQWLYVSLFIYFFLTIGLIVAIIFNFLPINSATTKNCPSVNNCPPCPPQPCLDLITTICPGANLSMNELENPNEAFSFYLLSGVAETPFTDTDIGSFRTVFGNDIIRGTDLRNYYPMVNLSNESAAVWRYSSQKLNFTQILGQFRVSTVAIAPNYYTAVMSGANGQPQTTVDGTVTYENGIIKFTDPSSTDYYLYVAEAGVEIPLAIDLPEGFYPVWTTITPTAIGTDEYFKYIWSLYRS